MKTFRAKSVEDWRHWLGVHHDCESEVIATAMFYVIVVMWVLL